jgi:hypothetical protein
MKDKTVIDAALGAMGKAYSVGFVHALSLGALASLFVGLAGLPWVITPLALAGCAAVIWLQTR